MNNMKLIVCCDFDRRPAKKPR